MSATDRQVLLDLLHRFHRGSKNSEAHKIINEPTQKGKQRDKGMKREVRAGGREMAYFYPIFQQKLPSGPEPTK